MRNRANRVLRAGQSRGRTRPRVPDPRFSHEIRPEQARPGALSGLQRRALLHPAMVSSGSRLERGRGAAASPSAAAEHFETATEYKHIMARTRMRHTDYTLLLRNHIRRCHEIVSRDASKEHKRTHKPQKCSVAAASPWLQDLRETRLPQALEGARRPRKWKRPCHPPSDRDGQSAHQESAHQHTNPESNT